MEFDGIEKYLCLHGNWYTIASVAHLSGDHSKITANAINAIHCLLKRHSRMRTRIRIEGHRYLLDVFDYDTLAHSVEALFSVTETTNESWEQIVENRCNHNPYSVNGSIDFPLFHFMLVLDQQSSSNLDTNLFHLIVFANHCVSDGRSGYILIHEFLTLVTSPDLNERFEPINTEVLPFIHQLIPRPFGHLYPILFFVAKHLFIRELRELRHLRIPIKSTPLIDDRLRKFDAPQYKTKFLFLSSSSSLYRNLKQQCHSYHVTVNGPLFICLLLASHRCFSLKNSNQLVPFSVTIPFDMRARLSESSALTSSSIGFFVGLGTIKLGRSISMHSTQFWPLAQKCVRITRKQLERNGVPLTMHVFSNILQDERIMNRITRQFPDGREGELAFSNVGQYPFACDYNKGQLQLHGIHVVNNASVYRNSAVVYVACAGDNQLDFSLAHEIESNEKAKEFLDYYIRLVETCANAEYCKPETTLEELLQCVESKQ